MSKRHYAISAALAILVLTVAGGTWYNLNCIARSNAVRAELAGVTPPVFAPQRVVYHITDDGGFFDRRHYGRLENLSRHVAAVGAERADIRVVLQGAGLALLERATDSSELRAKVDALRRAGVRFEVCKNSMIDRGTGLGALAGTQATEVVMAALPEIARLEGEGFVYIRL